MPRRRGCWAALRRWPAGSRPVAWADPGRFDLGPLFRRGIGGAGQTIVIVDSFGSPTITGVAPEARNLLVETPVSENEGTSGFPQIADQYAGRPLGLLNPALYALAKRPASGIVDITSGSNTVLAEPAGEKVTGFRAVRGYDLVSGLGTVDASLFVPSLAVTVEQERTQAAVSS
jgi:hypothetical protein